MARDGCASGEPKGPEFVILKDGHGIVGPSSVAWLRSIYGDVAERPKAPHC